MIVYFHCGIVFHIVSMMFINFKCYFLQAANPYVIKLSVLDDELALNVSV